MAKRTRKRKAAEREGTWDDFSPEAVKRAWETYCATASERICYRCANLVRPKGLVVERQMTCWRVVFPICVDHP